MNKKRSFLYALVTTVYLILIIMLLLVMIAFKGLMKPEIEELPENNSGIVTVAIPKEVTPVIAETDIEYLAKTTWGESRGCSTTEQAAVMWCILNRVDDKSYPDTIEEVVTQQNQFYGYNENHPVTEELHELAYDVIFRWYNNGTGRVLPKEYLYFTGDGEHNYFYKNYADQTFWDWSLISPYKEEL